MTWLGWRIGRAAHAASRLLDVPLRDVADLVVAQVELLRARLRMSSAPKGGLIRPVEGSPPAGSVDEERLDRIAVAVRRAATFGLFEATCLVRAVAMERMMARIPDGVGSAVVRVGVRPDGDRLTAHAWIAVGDRVFGDTAARVATYVPLQDFSGLSGDRSVTAQGSNDNQPWEV